MRLDASRSIAEQHLNPISPYIAGHGDPGGYAVIDRALTRWLAKQTGDRNQRIGYARGGKFHLAVPMTEAEAVVRDKAIRKRRQARALNVSVEVVDAVRAEREAERVAKLKAETIARTEARISALPAHIVEAFDLQTNYKPANLTRAEWVATLEPDAQELALTRRRAAQIAVAKRTQIINQPQYDTTQTLLTPEAQSLRAI